MFTLLLLGCHQPPRSAPPLTDSSADSASGLAEQAPSPVVETRDVDVLVTLDGAPLAEALVMQGGGTTYWSTDADGRVTVPVDLEIRGDLMIVASHPEARVWGEYIPDADEPAELTVALERYDTTDNHAYLFQDPGTPERRESTAQCAHCHIAMSGDWVNSVHASSASNVTVQDLYAGVGAAWASRADCEDAGGRWQVGSAPGTGEATERCYLGHGVLPALNDCGDDSASTSCDDPDATDSPDTFGACADCHAPGIDGALGGRDLLDATDFAYDYGVHCDVCHKAESIDLDAPAGVAGALGILRPSEEPLSAGVGDWYPMTFGPLVDVLNPRMGNIYREHYKDAAFCGACHELNQPALTAALDADRWPEGTLPVHSTYSEWSDGPMNPGAPCASCHMPPDADEANGADLSPDAEDYQVGIIAGWEREPGTVRRHTWTGPRSPEEHATASMLALAATVSIEATPSDEDLTARVTVRNVGPGHAIPTGEPLRSLLLTVSATCDGAPLAVIGGDVVPDYGGARGARLAGEDWTIWPEASPGQVIRVLALDEAWRDYTGFGPFGDGSFSPAEKGLQLERALGEAEVLSVDSDGRVTLDRPLPDGDVAWLGDSEALAGAAGFGFARVMVSADGERMVPHFMAADIASDNRLLPQTEWTSEHTFAPCDASPTVSAELLHRAYPLALADERGWPLRDTRMAQATVEVGP